MRTIDADALKELFSEVIGHIAKKPEMNGNLEHMIRASAMVIQMIDDAPTVQPDTTTHDSIPAETGGNDDDRTSGDCISRQAVTKFLNDWLSCLFENCHKQSASDLKMIIKDFKNLPSVQPDDDRLERCRFEYANACKIVTHPTPDTTKKDIADAYAVVRALNPIFGEEGFNGMSGRITDDLIGRAEAQTAIQFAARRYTVAHEAHGEGQVVWSDNLISVTDAMNVLQDLPSAQPEQLTDKEQRIFLAAMGREEKVCKHKDSLVRVCHEIERKVKGALWT